MTFSFVPRTVAARFVVFVLAWAIVKKSRGKSIDLLGGVIFSAIMALISCVDF